MPQRPSEDQIAASKLRRPIGISVLAVLLACLAVGAFVLSLTAEAQAELEAQWHLVRFSALLCGLTAMVAAVGLWKVRRWAYVAFVGWVAAVLLIGLSVPVVFPASRMRWWAALVWIGAVGAIMTPLARYVRRAMAPALRSA